MKVRKLVTISIGVSLAAVLSILESFIPTGIPGVKLGLANVVTLIILYLYSPKEAILVQLFRIFLVGLLYSGIFSISFLLSLVGGVISLLIMIGLYLTKKFSIFTISISGSLTHAISQILVSYLILFSSAVFYYLPIILTISIPTGIITATVSKIVLESFKVELKKPNRIGIIFSSLILLFSVLLMIVELSINNKENEGSIAKITYRNNLIAEINLNNPNRYKTYSEDFIEYNKDNNSYLYKFKVYNDDEKDYFYIIVEVLDSKIRIKEETCKKHICSDRGFIKTKYESIICLPNEFIITIENHSLNEIDTIM